MLFSGLPFLYYFLPIVLILYLIAPKKLKNSVLLLSSLVFYAWGEPKYVFLMIASIVLGYVLGLLIEKFLDTPLAKVFLALSVITSIGMLGYFKYADFFISNFNTLTGLSVPLLKIALPIGISFYTFQLLSYTIDVYRKDVPAQKNIVTLATYIALFPQLIAGPIVRYSDVEKQLTQRKHTIPKTADGIKRFMCGLSKKVLIANTLGELTDIFKSSQEKTVVFFWMYGIAFSLHIYFDFSGYSDMAIGLGKMFGFDFMENFNYPYISKTITEFWRRWHISLGSWFRDYVYIPLGGNRVSKFKWFRNIFVVWFLTGFWHGAAWSFILWGLYFAAFLLAEKLFLSKIIEKTKVIKHIYVLFFVMISFIIFNATDMSEAVLHIGGLFGIGASGFISASTVYYLKSYAFILTLGFIGATPLPKKIYHKIKDSRTVYILQPIVITILLVVITAYLVDGSFNPFLYFRF